MRHMTRMMRKYHTTTVPPRDREERAWAEGQVRRQLLIVNNTSQRGRELRRTEEQAGNSDAFSGESIFHQQMKLIFPQTHEDSRTHGRQPGPRETLRCQQTPRGAARRVPATARAAA